MQFFPFIPFESYDGGDSVPAIVTVSHQPSSQHTSAFQFTFSYIYLTDFFIFNESDPFSTIFLYNSMPLPNFTAIASIENSTGSIPFDFDEKRVEAALIPIIFLIFTNQVRSLEVYEVYFEAEWYSLPRGYDGGRVYHHSGVIPYSIADLTFEIVQTTSNLLTPNQNLQVQEQIFANVTVTFPEVCISY